MYHPDVAAAVKIVMQVHNDLRGLWYIRNTKYNTIILNIFNFQLKAFSFLGLDRLF